MELSTGERVWDRFLTESDKEHLAGSRDRRIGFGQRPALLAIDLYRWVFGDRKEPLAEAIKTWPGSCGPAAWDALPYIQKVLAAAREAGLPVIHATGLDGVGITGWNEAIHGMGRQAVKRFSDSTAEEKDRLRRRYDIVDEVAPIEGEAVIRKTAPSAFWGTPLIGHLTHLGIDTLIVVGESTSGCVRASVVDGASNRLRMIVVEEGVFDRHEAPHAINLFDMHQKYADVLPMATVLAHLEQIRSRNGVAAH